MPAYRFFLDQPFRAHERYQLPKEEAHHLTHVMRCREGEHIELVNGRGQLAHATLLPHAMILLDEVLEASPLPSLIIAQAWIKPNRLDIIVEKGTELGMTELWLFPGDKSEKIHLSEHHLTRFRHLSIAAMKQCGRLDLPSIRVLDPLSQWTKLPCTSYFGSLMPGTPWLYDIMSPGAPGLFVVGPEAGFSSQEETHLKKLGACGVTLHTSTLRAETAPLVALALMSQHRK